ncbi:MAG: DUF4253 domain-containing protein [Streptomyces sp.]|nr:DUF4253 domain-containing protein [Streptomyces sp.]
MDARHQLALDAAGLSGRPARVQDAAGGGSALLVDVSREEMLDAWAAARAAVDRTGRWPLLCSWHSAHDGDLFSRFYFDEGSKGADSSPAAVLARADTIDVDARLAEEAAQWFRAADDEAGPEREATLAFYGDAPPEEEIRAAAAGAPFGADRYLFDWERAREPLREPYQTVQDWFGSTEEAAALVLLPAAEPWAAYAYVDALHDACGYGQDLLVAAARRWYERYGAEPVAALDVMTWLTVARPPADPDDAWRLAFEHHVLAEATCRVPGVPLRQHARLLPHMNRWVLFSRP